MGEFEPDTFKNQEDAGFKQHKLFDIGDIISIKERVSFVDSCSRFGNVFVGRQNGFDLYRQTDFDTLEHDPRPVATVSLKGQLRWLAVSSCGLTVLVSTVMDGKTDNIFFDVRTLMKGESQPFARQNPPTSPGNGAVVSACWNPAINEIITMIYSSGAVEVLKVDKTCDVYATKPPMGANCIAWSPKGKQMVIGKRDGSLSQFTPEMIEKKKITSCPLLGTPAGVIDIAWLATYKFAITYSAMENDSLPNLFTVHLPEKGETRQPIWRCFEDPTYSMNPIRKAQLYLPLIVPWNCFAVLSSNSGDCVLMGKDNVPTGEHQIWSFADDARAELPLLDEDSESSVVGACWNFNSTSVITVGEKATRGPQLLVLSSLGVLVAFQFYNFFPDYVDLSQVLDTVPGGVRDSLPEDISISKPRASIPKPLARTSSVMPGTVNPIPKEIAKSTFGTLASNVSFVGAPQSHSTPSVKLFAPVEPKPVHAKTKSYEVMSNAPILSNATESHSFIEPQNQTFDLPKSTPVVPVSAPSAFCKSDLLDMVADFESELDDYKTKNAQLDVSMFNEGSRKTDVKTIDDFQMFVTAVKKNFDETKEEIHNLKLRSLEAFASYEAAAEMNKKKSFLDRNAAKITAPLCPTLSKQLQSIRSYKQYLNDSLHDLNILIQAKNNQNKENTSFSAVYRCMETNERVMFRQEQKVTRLTSQLNRIRLNQNQLYASPASKPSSIVGEIVPESPLSRSPIRPDHIDKLKKQLSARKSIPVRSSPKVPDGTTIVFNRKPQSVINASQLAHQPHKPQINTPIPRLNLDDSISETVPEPAQTVRLGSNAVENPMTVTTQDVKIVRDRASNVVSYMPANMVIPVAKPGQSVSSKPEGFGSDSKFNLNNPPQVVNAAHLQQSSKSVFPLAAQTFIPSANIPQAAQQAVQKTLNTVNLIAKSVPNVQIGRKQSYNPTPDDSPDESEHESEPEAVPEIAETPVRTERKQTKPGPLFQPANPARALFAAGAAAPKPIPKNPFESAGALSNFDFGSSQKLDQHRETYQFRKEPSYHEDEDDLDDDLNVSDVSNEPDEDDDPPSEDGQEVVSEPEDTIIWLNKAETAKQPTPPATPPKKVEVKPAPLTETANLKSEEEPAAKGLFGSASGSGKGLFASSTPLFGSTITNSSSSGNIFGAAKSTSSGLFGSKSEPISIAGLTESVKEPSKSEPVSGIFGSVDVAESESVKKSAVAKNLFGTPTEAKSEAPSNLFGSNVTSQSTGLFGSKPPTGLFGSATPAAGDFSSDQKSAFGDTKPVEAPKSQGLFGSSTTTTSSASGGLFGMTPAASTGGLFGSSEEKSSGGGLFGSGPVENKSSGGLFGSSNEENKSSTGLFGSSTKPTGGLFGSSTITEQPTSGGLFGSGGGFSGLGAQPDPEKAKLNPFGGNSSGQAVNSTSQGLFGSSKPAAFGSSMSNPTPSSSGPFSGQSGGAFSAGGGFGAASPVNPPSAFGSGAFGGGSTSPSAGFGGSAFGGGGNNAFGTPPANPGFGNNPPSGSGLFGSSGAGFGTLANSPPGGTGGGFGSAPQNTGGFGSAPQQNSSGFGGINSPPNNQNQFSGNGFSGFR